MATILDQAWLQGKFEKSEPKILFCVQYTCSTACTKRRNVETKRPKRNGRNHRNHRNDRNETTETKQPKRNDRNETAETKRPKRNGRKYKLQEKWKILIKI